MDSVWTEYAGERYHILGVAITDPELVGRTKRVVRCCLGLFVVLMVRTVILLMLHEPTGATLLSLLFNVSIPAFGYLGARDGSSTLMCIFVALMILNAANAIAVLFMIGYAYLTAMPQRRADGSYQEFTMTPSMWVQVFLIAAWAIMALIAAFHANKLFSKLASGEAVAEKHNNDPEIGLPEMDTRIDGLDAEPNSFGLPATGGHLNEDMDDVDDFHHAVNLSNRMQVLLMGIRWSLLAIVLCYFCPSLFFSFPMSTAHKPTFHPARGSASGGNVPIPTALKRARDLPGHSILLFRERATTDSVEPRDMLKRKLELADSAPVQPPSEVLVKSAPQPFSEDEDEIPEELLNDSCPSSTEDEEEALLAELAKIKEERAREKAELEKIEKLKVQAKVAAGNPLLGLGGGSSLKKQWTEDTVFHRSGRFSTQETSLVPSVGNKFVNDVIRSDFHKKFLNKYIV